MGPLPHLSGFSAIISVLSHWRGALHDEAKMAAWETNDTPRLWNLCKCERDPLITPKHSTGFNHIEQLPVHSLSLIQATFLLQTEKRKKINNLSLKFIEAFCQQI